MQARDKSAARLQRVPFQRKVIEYVEEEVEERVPVTVTRRVLEQRVVKEVVPVQRKVIDFCKVQLTRSYFPQQVTTEELVYEPTTRVIQVPRIVPVERQVLHYEMGIQNLPPELRQQIRRSGPVVYSEHQVEAYKPSPLCSRLTRDR